MPFVWKQRWTKCGDNKQSNQLFVRPQHRISGKKSVFKRSGVQGHMLGSVSCRLLASSKPSSLSYLSLAQSSRYNSKLQSVKVALPPKHPSRSHVHSFKLISRPAATASLPRTIRRPRSPGQNAYSQKNAFSSSVMDSCGHRLPYSPVKAFHPHSSSCSLAGNGSVGPTIWHALLPAHHLTPLEQDPSLPPKCAVVGEAGLGSPASAAIISGSAEATVVSGHTLQTYKFLNLAIFIILVEHFCMDFNPTNVVLYISCSMCTAQHFFFVSETSFRRGLFSLH